MESYEGFCESKRQHLKNKFQASVDKAEPKINSCSSIIRFCGMTILPPVLTREKRIQMQNYRHEALKCENKKKNFQEDELMKRVQAVLENVKLRRAPTLNEFVQSDPIFLSMTSSEIEEKSESLDECINNETVINFEHTHPQSPLIQDDKSLTPTVHDSLGIVGEGVPVKDFKLTQLGDSAWYTTSFHGKPQIQNFREESLQTCIALEQDSSVCHNVICQDNLNNPTISSTCESKDNAETVCHLDNEQQIYLERNKPLSGMLECFFLHSTHDTSKDTQAIFANLQQSNSVKKTMLDIQTCALDDAVNKSKCGKPYDEINFALNPPKEPRQLSLQNLLKMSREYRDNQRQLRTTRARGISQNKTESLSDKENNENIILQSGCKKGKDKRGSVGRVRFVSSEMSNTNDGIGAGPLCNANSYVSVGVDPTFSVHKNELEQINIPVAVTVSHDKVVDRLYPAADTPFGILPKENHHNLNYSQVTNDINTKIMISDMLHITAPDLESTSFPSKIPQHLQNKCIKNFNTIPHPEFSRSPVHSKKNHSMERPSVAKPLNIFTEDEDCTATKSKAAKDFQMCRPMAKETTPMDVDLTNLKSLLQDLKLNASSTLDIGTNVEDQRPFYLHECSATAFDKDTLQSDKYNEHSSYHLVHKSVKKKSNEEPLVKNTLEGLVVDLLPNSVFHVRQEPLDNDSTAVVVPCTDQEHSKNTSCTGFLNKPVEVKSLWPDGLLKMPHMSMKYNPLLRRSDIQDAFVIEAEDKWSYKKEHHLKITFPRNPSLRTWTTNPSDLKTSNQFLNETSKKYSSGSIQESGEWNLNFQPGGSILAIRRIKIAAAVKGYLTRRLLQTERLMGLIRIIKDTRQFIQSLESQSPGKTGFNSRRDLSLEERVLLQLRSALYEFHDIFFTWSTAERMQIISHDRLLRRERELKQRVNKNKRAIRKSPCLSSATLKARERKKKDRL
ncbi:uncharacterized protein LOC114664944 isoform X1 [Erpetoichthys calabaricus]|uniref:uncharacterized protein LOC114664944 isoform X1 n=2 Tax=Erpetoichthys calabaricus TaxID=27687 RepID=UPI002234B8C1|nr:uncharacterized protein LOC114664944 isoform X1 [Erpetoichthys calabaricus]